jgi:Raf kinase inhibitor-like YbhB/YbcL family protein
MEKMNRFLIGFCSLWLGTQFALGDSAKVTVTSPAFEAGRAIPAKYSCQGEDISPPLKWEGAPADTKSFALICDDPDAPGGTWVHWVIYNLPAATSSLPENMPKSEFLQNDAIQGANSFNKTGYGGPCPPAGKAHRYFFKVYALDKGFIVKKGQLGKDELLAAMRGHILAQGQLMGTYKRQ